MTKKLSEMSLPELHQKRSILKGILIGFAVLWVIMMLTFIYLKAKPGLLVQFIIPFMCVWPALSSFNKIKEELKLRSQNGKA
ncbi:hypothetical protein [Mucilaginibacter terrae]|nr:hypothetical protein [Mucilaginibacter terrae]